jgi:hypothetical protein
MTARRVDLPKQVALYTDPRGVKAQASAIGHFEIEYDRSSRPRRDTYRSRCASLRHSPRPLQTTVQR